MYVIVHNKVNIKTNYYKINIFAYIYINTVYHSLKNIINENVINNYKLSN